VDKIKALHVYDFDNTRRSLFLRRNCGLLIVHLVFNSPLPNPKLWNGPTIGMFQTQDTFATGGWWHDARILGATGEGVEVEEKRSWAGWWNEQIVQLIQLSIEQKDVLTVLLTGRSETGFAPLIKKMVASKGLQFDMIVLKPKVGPNKERFSSTMLFKQAFLESLIETYRHAEEIRVYEDRIKHTKGFRDFFMDYNKRQNGIHGKATRGPITAEVIQVADCSTLLDPVVETVEIQRLINDHNSLMSKSLKYNIRRYMIKKTVFYTGYLITNADTQKLLTLAQLPPNMPETELKFLANNVLITPRPCPNSILDKVGGMGNKLLWEVTGTAIFENKIWAAQVRPVPQSAKYYTENPVPIVVLALRKGARPIDAGKIQNWQPVPPDKAFIFETTVGEKVLLRVEEEDPRENEYESLFPNKSFKRKHAPDDEPARPTGPSRGGYQNQNHNPNSNNNNSNRGRGNNYRGNSNTGRGGGFRNGSRGNASGGRGRGRGGGAGGHHYRSLDDMPTSNANTSAYAANNSIMYEDLPTAPKNFQYPQQGGYNYQQQFSTGQQGGSGAPGTGNGNGAPGLYY
jgi:hypothetical protein